ncbi:hypothetical protein WJX74_001111 [Apatococcus lobatus]|uniref:Dolichyldiphosphatase n=1 Tax=Apatococcus lobatus TaxID=904363 RepID=A0AAW1RY40_9CHLO
MTCRLHSVGPPAEGDHPCTDKTDAAADQAPKAALGVGIWTIAHEQALQKQVAAAGRLAAPRTTLQPWTMELQNKLEGPITHDQKLQRLLDLMLRPGLFETFASAPSQWIETAGALEQEPLVITATSIEGAVVCNLARSTSLAAANMGGKAFHALQHVYLLLLTLRRSLGQGAGRQSKGVLINFVAYYIAGLSSGLLLVCRLHWEVEGLVGGLILGTFIHAVCYIYLVYCLNWQQEFILALDGKEIPEVQTRLTLVMMPAIS